MNISVGSYGKRGMSEDSALVKGVNRAWDAGLVVVVAAGNNGPAPLSVTTPGISRKVITVGCSDDHMEVLVGKNRMVDYSGRGPTLRRSASRTWWLRLQRSQLRQSEG